MKSMEGQLKTPAVAKAVESIKQRGLDAVVATSYENVSYLSNTAIITQRVIPERIAACIVTATGDTALLVCAVEALQALQESTIRDLRTYTEFVEDPIDNLVAILTELGLDSSSLAFELGTLSARNFTKLASRLPAARLDDADDLFARLRMVKTEEEASLLARAALVTDRAIDKAFSAAAPGITERAIAAIIAEELQAGGADSVAFLTLGAGESASVTHPAATDRPLESADVIRCDVGGYFGGYYSDLARTAVISEASDQLRRSYQGLWSAHEEVIGHMGPGVRACDLFDICSKAFELSGLTLNSTHIGHSLGLGLHERPMLSPYDQTALEEGMLIAVEPAHRDGGPILHVEDLVRITPGGQEVVSRAADWSQLRIL